MNFVSLLLCHECNVAVGIGSFIHCNFVSFSREEYIIRNIYRTWVRAYIEKFVIISKVSTIVESNIVAKIKNEYGTETTHPGCIRSHRVHIDDQVNCFITKINADAKSTFTLVTPPQRKLM